VKAFAGTAAVSAGAALVRRHTRRVAVLKRVLPAIGVSLLLLVAIWPRLVPMWERMRVSFPAIDLRDAQQLRMINPRYSGTDRAGRPFVVTAASGRQIPDRQDLMSLQAPHAEIRMQSGAEITVTAISAVYQSQANVVDMFGDVTVTHQNGTRFLTQSARVNVAQNAAEGSDPVSGQGPAGAVKAQGFRILDKGDTVIFTGRSEAVLNGARHTVSNTAPPALPAPVAGLAAQVEAEAMPVLTRPERAESSRPARPRRKAAARSAARAGPHIRKAR
jgi:lipopolysaccharide export system protein LptC